MSVVVSCLGGYVCGLVLAQYLLLPPIPGFLFCVLLFLFLLRCRNLRIIFYSLFLFSLVTGLLRYPAQLAPYAADRGLDRLIDQGVLRLEGRVLATHERPHGGLSIDLEMCDGGATTAVSIAGGRLRLFIDHAQQIPPLGARLFFRSKVRRTRNFATPGEFDYVRHLAYQHLWHTAYVVDTRGLAIIASSPDGLLARIGSLRQTGLDMINAALPADKAKVVLLKALLLGEKGAMSKELRQKLAHGGVSHLFAISGLHLGLLALLLYTLLKYVYSRSTHLLLWQPPRRVLWPLVLPFLFLYLLITGDALATRRAFCALLIASSLCLVRRQTAPLSLLFSLAYLFLLFEPLALWQPSFLLSFSGVLGILLWQKQLSRLLQPCPLPIRYPLQLFGISLAAFIATLPAVIYCFHLFAPAGILNNLFAIPLVSFVALPMGIAGLIVCPVSLSAGSTLLKGAAGTLQLVVKLADLTTSLPIFSARSIFITPTETFAVLLGCLALLVGWQRKKALLLILPAVLLFTFVPPAGLKTELILFSVGQGEAMLLRTQGKNILIDGGGLRGKNYDVGERLLAPALGWLGVQSLDAIILTHNHPDHSGGLSYVINKFKVRGFWYTSRLASLRPALRRALQNRGVPVHRYAAKGWTRPRMAGLRSLALFSAPLERVIENDRSLCLYLPTEIGGILLTGDLEARGVDALLARPLPGAVSLLKAPHHGSAGSNPRRLMRKLRPEIVALSAGYANSYHFPSNTLIKQAAVQKIAVWRTDIDGTIRLRVGQHHWRAEHWVGGLFR